MTYKVLWNVDAAAHNAALNFKRHLDRNLYKKNINKTE